MGAWGGWVGPVLGALVFIGCGSSNASAVRRYQPWCGWESKWGQSAVHWVPDCRVKRSFSSCRHQTPRARDLQRWGFMSEPQQLTLGSCTIELPRSQVGRNRRARAEGEME